ncbi:hypothetical protein NADE_006862 [Nannochloris sp. 'desiccata']|nr:hypothetical protein NADE_006862 [Chlorella desiccata (nom. nud.)]
MRKKRLKTLHDYGSTRSSIDAESRMKGASEKVVVTEGTPAVVYKAGGAHYWELLTEAQKYLSKPVELPNIYVVTKANVLPFGKDLPLSKVSETIPTAATKARIKGTITDTNSKIQDYLVDNVVGYHQLDLPCVVLATHEVNEALLAAAKEAGSQDLKMPSEEKYYLLFASVDLCQLRLLTLEGASVLGHANEAIADSTLSVPITSPATKRAHWKLLGTEILNLPKQLKSKVGSNYKKIKRRIPPANMFSTFLRYSRNPKDYKNGTQVGGRTVNGEPVKQQTACSSAIASREVHNVIMQAMKPITLLQRDFLAANNPTTTSVVVNWMNMNAKAITTGGWGVLPHLDGMDSGGVAYIIQYGLGDLRELHGGHMCLPQLHLICPVGACTVHFLRTGSLLHNSLPHVASEKARVVGTSLHVNKSFLIMSNAQSRMQGLDGEGYVQYAQESCIDSETLKDCTEMKKLLKFGNWRV